MQHYSPKPTRIQSKNFHLQEFPLKLPCKTFRRIFLSPRWFRIMSAVFRYRNLRYALWTSSSFHRKMYILISIGSFSLRCCVLLPTPIMLYTHLFYDGRVSQNYVYCAIICVNIHWIRGELKRLLQEKGKTWNFQGGNFNLCKKIFEGWKVGSFLKFKFKFRFMKFLFG